MRLPDSHRPVISQTSGGLDHRPLRRETTRCVFGAGPGFVAPGSSRSERVLPGLQQAWRHHLARLWDGTELRLPATSTRSTVSRAPRRAFYAALGCGSGEDESRERRALQGLIGSLVGSKMVGTSEKSKEVQALAATTSDLLGFRSRYAKRKGQRHIRRLAIEQRAADPCSSLRFRSTRRKVVVSRRQELLYSAICAVERHPIQTLRRFFATSAAAGVRQIAWALALTRLTVRSVERLLGADLAWSKR